MGKVKLLKWKELSSVEQERGLFVSFADIICHKNEIRVQRLLKLEELCSLQHLRKSGEEKWVRYMFKETVKNMRVESNDKNK